MSVYILKYFAVAPELRIYDGSLLYIYLSVFAGVAKTHIPSKCTVQLTLGSEELFFRAVPLVRSIFQCTLRVMYITFTWHDFNAIKNKSVARYTKGDSVSKGRSVVSEMLLK